METERSTREAPALSADRDSAEPRRVPYGSHRDRLDLTRALPLTTPLAVLIDPTNGCNFKCHFCPTGNPSLLPEQARRRGLMDFALFRKIIDDLAAFPAPIKSLHLYKEGEPLVNRWFAGMVRFAKARGVARYVETTTNGALLGPAVAEALVDAGLDGIRISVYGTDDAEYHAATRTRTAYETVLENVRHLHRLRTARAAPLHIHCKILNTAASVAGRERFIADFTPISDSLYVHPLHGQELTLPGFEKVPDRARRVCSEPFIKLAVKFDGKVSACCADWTDDTVVGDVTRDSLVDIWAGAPLQRLRLIHLAGQKDTVAACRTCDYMHTLPADNDLDAAADTLADRFRALPPES